MWLTNDKIRFFFNLFFYHCLTQLHAHKKRLANALFFVQQCFNLFIYVKTRKKLKTSTVTIKLSLANKISSFFIIYIFTQIFSVYDRPNIFNDTLQCWEVRSELLPLKKDVAGNPSSNLILRTILQDGWVTCIFHR